MPGSRDAFDRRKAIDDIVFLFAGIGRSSARFPAEPWMNLNLTIGQLKSLFFIESQGSSNFKSLAAALGVTPPNITGIVDRLVEQGLVSREENAENRREMVLSTTHKGRLLLGKLRETHMERLRDLLSRLDADSLSALARGLGALAAATRADDGPRE